MSGVVRAVKSNKETSELHRRCEYIVPRKKRRCRMLSKVGNRFCGEHLIHDPENQASSLWFLCDFWPRKQP